MNHQLQYRRPARSNTFKFKGFLLTTLLICAYCWGLSTTSAQVTNATPLTVICPTNMSLGFLTETGTVATFTATVTGGCSNADAVFTPPSETLFPIGVTPVSLLVT